MADLRIVDAPLLSTVKGSEKIPTGGEGNFSISVNQVADFAKLKWVLATEGYVNNAVGNVQADLNLHKNNESNPHNVTKTQVGLGNVDNTADLDKPLSNATQSAIITANSGKADKSYVDSQDQLKADKAYVETSLSLKANKTDLTASKISSDGNQNQQEINDFGGAKWHSESGGYAVGSTVKLANGDVVKSTVANNIVNPNFAMDGWFNESLLQRNRIVYFEDYISDLTGTVDVTDEMQSLLDSHDGDIYAKPSSVFKTSNTLFNRKHNRTVDFHNAKIVNKANSRYAIVTISPAFTGSTDAALNTFVTERHYGEEVKFSHVVNLRYEMSANTDVGANLGVGIIYGYKSKLSRMFPSMTNGNGVEIRNSLRCGLYRSEIEGHRNYTCFVFMSQRCEIIGNKFKGGARGVCTKMNRDGDPYCGHIIAFNNFEDATNNGRAIIGGEWRETTLTDEIYVSGHEWVDGNEIYGNTFNNIAQPQTILAACFSRNWKIYDNTFKWNNLQGIWINLGGEGNVVNGEKLGGNHEVYSNHLYDYNQNNNALISSRLSNRVYNNYFHNCKALYWYNAEADYAGNSLSHAEFFRNHFVGDSNGVYCANNEAHGFVAKAGVEVFKFENNGGVLNVLLNGANKTAAVVTSRAQSTYLGGGDVKFLAGSGVETVIANLILTGSIEKLSGRKIEISAPLVAYCLQIQAGVTVSAKHEGNTYTLSGTATTARAVVNNAELIDGLNTYFGAWSAKIFNTFSKPVALTNIDRQWGVIPTSGSYNKGDFVRNINPNITSNVVVFGWLRITTGSNHILNTDWVEIKQSLV